VLDAGRSRHNDTRRPQRACSPHGAPGPGQFASCREPSPPPQRQPPGAVDFARFALHIAVSHRRRIQADALPPSPPETRSSFGLATFRSPSSSISGHGAPKSPSEVPDAELDRRQQLPQSCTQRPAARHPWRQSTFACLFPAPLPRGHLQLAHGGTFLPCVATPVDRSDLNDGRTNRAYLRVVKGFLNAIVLARSGCAD
jgi:hypothetical protein